VKRFLQLFLILLIINPVFLMQGQDNNLGVQKIVIDPGHGGKDPGNLGTGRYKKTEKDVVLDISLMLGNYLKSEFPDISILYTRTEDKFIKLSERTKLANDEKADLFISIHCDAFDDQRVHGSTTYVMGMHKHSSNLKVAIRENSSILMENNYKVDYEGFNPSEPESYIALSMYQSNHIENSLLIASKIQDQFRSRVSRKDRGVKQAGFMVISRAAMPSVLVELGFLTNNMEEDFLNSEDGKVYMASAIFRAVKDYKITLDSMISESDIKLQNETELFFSLQFMSSLEKIDINNFMIDEKDIIYQFKEKKYYKYAYGKEAKLEDLAILKKKLNSYGYNDYFTIAFLNGEKISLSEALSIVK